MFDKLVPSLLNKCGPKLAGGGLPASFTSRAEGDVVIDGVVATVRVVVADEGAAHVIEWIGVDCRRGFLHPFEVWKDVLHPLWVLGNASLGGSWYWDSFLPPVGAAAAGAGISTWLIARARGLGASFHPTVGLAVEWSAIGGTKSAHLSSGPVSQLFSTRHLNEVSMASIETVTTYLRATALSYGLASAASSGHPVVVDRRWTNVPRAWSFTGD